MIDRGKFNVLGIRIDAVDYDAAVERICTAASERRPLAVSALAVHGLMTGVLDEIHRYRLNRFDVLVPDGQPVRWALDRLHGTRLPDRVYGPNLMLALCRRAADEQLPIFLYGSTPETIALLEANLRQRFPSLPIAGTSPSRFRRMTREEADDVVARVQASGAQMMFVGLGCPRQEVFAYEFAPRLSLPVIAVGAAFPFHAGELAQAPKYMQDRGLEWLFRLWNEPRRLWRRYLLLNPLFCALLAMQALRLRTFSHLREVQPEQELLFG